MPGLTKVGRAVLIGACGWLGVACNSDDQGPNETPRVIEKSPVKSGDLQNGPAGLPLGNQLQVLVTKDGLPESNIMVTWSTNNGTVSPTAAPTNDEGVSAAAWTLGPETGTQTATATLSGATGSPVTFTATATEPQGPPGNLSSTAIPKGH